MGNTLSGMNIDNYDHIQMCITCKRKGLTEQIATHRCSLSEKDKEIILKKYPHLENHFISECGFRYNYVGCKNCISDEYIHIFTVYPEGWMGNWKCADNFEKAKLENH